MKSSNLWAGIVLLSFLFGICANTAMALSGSGTEPDPWLIQSLADFDEFAADANYWDDYTRLETDVNLAGRVYERAVIAWDEDDVEDWFKGIVFTGVFNGNDRKIIDLTIHGGANDYLGLFGKINGEVKNLGIEGGSVSGDVLVGRLAGYNSGSISDCFSTGDINGTGNVGGLVGYNNSGGISDCFSTGDVSGNIAVGGLVGSIGYDSISDCYSTGDVSGNSWVGGLMGWMHGYSSVSNCYSTGDVSGDGDFVGGLMGWNAGSVSDCFWDTATQTYGVTRSIGHSRGGTTANVHALPTSQLHQQSTFTDWDFINVWNIGENQTYPYLRTVPAGDINKDKIVNFLDLCIIAQQWCNEE